MVHQDAPQTLAGDEIDRGRHKACIAWCQDGVGCIGYKIACKYPASQLAQVSNRPELMCRCTQVWAQRLQEL